jgi:penicillin amidase
MPSIWYEVGLHCTPQGPACPYQVTGVSFPGAPGVIIGHNERIAWGMTNVGPDVQDVYVEKINPANPNQYEVNGQWVDMDLVQDTIRVAGGDPVELTVRHTRHGPLIWDDALQEFQDKAGIDLPQPYGLALRWTALEPNFTFPALWQIDLARNWDEFRAAAAQFDSPSQNLVYADVDGNIGYQTPGKIPIRNTGHSGLLPVPGWTDDYEWQGYIPFEELPHTLNPPQGYIATANNAVVGPEYRYPISSEWDYGYRARRIVDMIEAAPGPIDVAYIQQMQGDDKNLSADTLVPILLQIPLDDVRLSNARALLDGWDGQESMDSAPAALFEAFSKHLLAGTFHDDLPEDSQPGGGDQWFEVLRRLVQQPDSAWWDDRSTPEVESRDDMFRQALTAAVDELEGSLGKNPGRWTWGDLHTITFRNPSLGESGIGPIEAIFNRGPFRTAGGNSIVNATGWDVQGSYEVNWLPSMRLIVDMGDLPSALMMHTTGQSGHAYHRDYANMADPWRQIEYHPMLWERGAVENSSSGHLRLVP